MEKLRKILQKDDDGQHHSTLSVPKKRKGWCRKRRKSR